MKSIIQEASSIAKAIEKAWISAGKPRDFSVKIFEEPQKNFFGFTKKLAKIGIFFNEQSTQPKSDFSHQGKERPSQKMTGAPRQQPPQKKGDTQGKEKNGVEKIAHQNLVERHFFDGESQDDKIVWAPEMIEKASSWLKDALQSMNLSSIDHELKADHYVLMIKFNKPLIEDVDQEKQLFKGFSFLMLQALKKTFKRPLRGFKITLSRA